MSGSNIEDLIYTETEKRLNEMEDGNYEFPKPVNAADVTGITVMISVSMLLIILCMTGVIK